MRTVLCIMPTFDRVERNQSFIEESIESFLRQGYKKKTLVICNDNPNIELRCPLVTVENLPYRFKTLGEKYNYIAYKYNADIIFPWEDDDLMLHNHIETCVKNLGDADYYFPGNRWFWDGQGLHHEHAANCVHHASCFTKDAFEKVLGYPPVTAVQDQLLHQRLSKLEVATGQKEPREWTYIYRFGVGQVNLSGMSKPDMYYREVTTNRNGGIELFPHYERNYEKIIANYLASIPRTTASR